MASVRFVRAVTVLGLVGGLGAALLAGCGSANSAASPATGTHVVTDSSGASVTVPDKVSRVADAWPAHPEIVYMLDGPNKIVASVLTPSLAPWLYVIDPSLHNAQNVFPRSGVNIGVNIEALAGLHPDVVFASDPSPFAQQISVAGIPTLQLIFQDFAGLKKVVNTTADVLGPAAKAQAQRYDGYLDAKLAAVTAQTSKIPMDQRPSVLHIASLHPLLVDGTDTIMDDWIGADGGRNAATVSGYLRPVNSEQILTWNPA